MSIGLTLIVPLFQQCFAWNQTADMAFLYKAQIKHQSYDPKLGKEKEQQE